jgi:hypothetical protein
MSVWFWCSEKGPAPIGLTRMYETLKCNKKHGQETQNQTNGLDSHPNEKTGQNVVYVLVAIGLVCLVVTALVVAFVVKRKCKQATEENGWYVDRNSFIFQNKRDDENVYEEIRL